MSVRSPMNERATWMNEPATIRAKFSTNYSTTRVQRPAPNAICMQISWESQHMQKQHMQQQQQKGTKKQLNKIKKKETGKRNNNK